MKRQPPLAPRDSVAPKASEATPAPDASRRSPADAPGASHGYRNEVTWEGGQGRQPYPNQEPDAPQTPAASGDFPEGKRGMHSGVTLEQMRKVRRKP